MNFIKPDRSDLLIETDRLIIRPFEEKDIEPSYEMNLDPEVSRYTADGGVVSRDQIENRIHENVFGDYQKYGFGRLAVELKAEGKFIGFTGLKYLDDMNEIDLGYRFMSAYWGKGIATESCRASLKLGFDKMKLNKIIAMVLPDNTASKRVLDKVGFAFEKEMEEEGLRFHLYAISN